MFDSSPAKNDDFQRIIDGLLAVAGKSGWTAQLDRVSKELTALPFQNQAAFVFAVLNWCQTVATSRDYDNQNWTVSQVLQAVLERLTTFSKSERREFVRECTRWFAENPKNNAPTGYYFSNFGWFQIKEMVSRQILETDCEEEDFDVFIGWTMTESFNMWQDVAALISHLKKYKKSHEISAALREKLSAFADFVAGHHFRDFRKKAQTLREIAGINKLDLPVQPGEAWSDQAIADVTGAKERAVWIALFNECLNANGSKPGAKWTNAIVGLVEKIGFEEFRSHVLRWFPLVDKPRTKTLERQNEWQPDPNLLLGDESADILKGLVWICSLREDREIARALTALALSAYKKVPLIGPRCVRVGNACVWALGQMNLEGVGQLALLKLKVKFGTAQKGIEKALNETAKKVGLSTAELEEMSVPTYGLTEVGRLREQFGEFAAEITVTGTNSAALQWFGGAGKAQKSVPAFVKENHAEELKELNQTVKDIKKMLPAQRDRIENLYLEERRWSYRAWRERYIDHPLVGTLARRLIWRFDEATTAVFADGRLVDADGRELRLFDDSQVELWHPLHSTIAEVLAWRAFLEKHEIRQPFKQAHREIYVLTDAERRTGVYSNRFAAHIIKQHQFNALCGQRGWKNKLRLMVDDDYEPPTRWLPKHELRAEFWVESIGDDFETDTTAGGTYLYLATDQVRFYPPDAPRHYVHAGGGGYSAGWNQTQTVEPVALDRIPPLVFSEIMRDVDLFVGVCSLGNDPNWTDGGRETHRNYWHEYSFGDLSATAKTRKEVLENLIPRLKIAARCAFEEKFLIVAGDLRTYRIHLGSGNILMSPNDEYLCIVPSAGAESFGQGRVFLPFEGDRVLSIILSKAFMLAEDTKISDPTITRQIKK